MTASRESVAALDMTPAPATVGQSRLTGVDIARSLAIFGMIVVHTGVPFLPEGSAETVYSLARGRSAILFAFLAGISLALISGRQVPRTGRTTTVKVATRALILLLIGSGLAMLDSGVAVILNYYGFFFLLAVPLLRLRARALILIAVVIAAFGPQVSMLLRWGFEFGPLPWQWLDTVNGIDPLSRVSGAGVLDFLVFGDYPALTFMAFLVAGIAVGRLDLYSTRIRVRLLAIGGVLTVAGYGISALVLYGLGVENHLRTLPTALPYSDFGVTAPERSLGRMFGMVPADDAGWVFVATPHSGTSFEIIGSGGVALTILALCLVIGDRFRIVLYPLASVGSMALTVYTAHVLILAWIAVPNSDIAFLSEIEPEFFVIGAVVFATVWRVMLGRGPLERLLGFAASNAARAADWYARRGNHARRR